MRTLALVAAASTAFALVPAGPAGAGQNHTITADPTALRPDETTTVTGTSDCNSSAYTVTLTYTNPEGDTATATATGTTDASGEYTQAITVPETAVAGEPASVQSTIPACGSGGPAAASNTVALTINAYEGTLSASPDQGPVGTEVSITGTNCYGDDIVVVFGNEDGEIEVENVTLNEDRTFSATFTIPEDVPPGQYAFAAECPGTDFPLEPFTVVAADDEEQEPAPPATPVGGTPTFTG